MSDSPPTYRFRGHVQPQRGIRASVLTSEGDEEGISVLRLYDPIDSWGGDWGVSAKEFAASLAGLPDGTQEIRLHINSPGGEVFEAIAILNQLRQHEAKVVAYVDGIAASAASVLAAGADETVMGQNATLMVHDAWGFVIGNAADMHSQADVLDKLSDNLASVYAAKANGTVEEWRDIMRAETWMTATEALDAGLADRIGSQSNASAASARFDLTVFSYAGRDDAPAPRIPLAPAARATKPPAEPAENNTPIKEGTDTMPELNQGLRERLGISADAELDEDGLLAALDEALAEQTATPAVSAPGTVVLDEAQYRELQASANDGREARKQQLAAERESIVNAAIKDGKIPPSRKNDWLNAIEKDPAMAETLNSLAKGLIPIKAEGYTGGVDEASDEDAMYSKLWGSTETKGA